MKKQGEDMAAIVGTSGSDRDELIKLATAAEQAAKAADATPKWPQCAEALCDGRWRLVATTRTGGSELLQQMGKQPALGTFRVEQDWSQRDGSLRCEHVVTVGRPNGGLLSAWTLLPAGGQSSLRLQHSARVVNDGAQANVPLRIAIELDALLLDGNRAAGEPVERIVSLPLPPQLLQLLIQITLLLILLIIIIIKKKKKKRFNML